MRDLAGQKIEGGWGVFWSTLVRKSWADVIGSAEPSVVGPYLPLPQIWVGGVAVGGFLTFVRPYPGLIIVYG